MKKFGLLMAVALAALVGSASPAGQTHGHVAAIGGGVRHPWTSPYVIVMATPERTTIRISKLGVVA